jgi:heat shock protein HslJ
MQNKKTLFVVLILLLIAILLFLFQKKDPDPYTETLAENNPYAVDSNYSGDGSESSGESVSQGLETTEWVWVKTEFGDGTVVRPGNHFFRLTMEYGDALSSTDCNSFFMKYNTQGNTIRITGEKEDMLLCPESMDRFYGEHLLLARSYEIDGDNLRLTLGRDSGVMHFAEEYYLESNPELIICTTDVVDCGDGTTAKRIAPACIHELCQ